MTHSATESHRQTGSDARVELEASRTQERPRRHLPWMRRIHQAWVQAAEHAESGQAIVWVAMCLPLLVSVVGLSLDSGTVFAARRELQNVADAAARAGATQVDVERYRQSGGTSVVLEPNRARSAAAAVLASQDVHIRGTVAADSRRVVVEVHRDVPTAFLRLAGISTVDIAATAPAEVRFGVEAASR